MASFSQELKPPQNPGRFIEDSEKSLNHSLNLLSWDSNPLDRAVGQDTLGDLLNFSVALRYDPITNKKAINLLRDAHRRISQYSSSQKIVAITKASISDHLGVALRQGAEQIQDEQQIEEAIRLHRYAYRVFGEHNILHGTNLKAPYNLASALMYLGMSRNEDSLLLEAISIYRELMQFLPPNLHMAYFPEQKVSMKSLIEQSLMRLPPENCDVPQSLSLLLTAAGIAQKNDSYLEEAREIYENGSKVIPQSSSDLTFQYAFGDTLFELGKLRLDPKLIEEALIHYRLGKV